MWASPAECCFLWMGGFRPSDLLKTPVPQLDPLTEQQMVGICGLEQSLQQAEEALTQGLEQLHQPLAVTVAGSRCLADDANIGSFMVDMAVALGKLSNLEGFVIQMRRWIPHHRVSESLKKQNNQGPSASARRRCEYAGPDGVSLPIWTCNRAPTFCSYE